MDKDLFARMLALSLSKKIDLAYVLTFPLTPVPSTLCHPDGSFIKTQKSTLNRHLEGKLDSKYPDVYKRQVQVLCTTLKVSAGNA